MSIVALKRKSMTQYGKGHVDAKGVFSLNGTVRHPPPTLGRSIYPTPMKGPDPKGHGCGRRCRVPGRFARICGSSYPIEIHYTCETVQTEVHPSVKNTSARLNTLHIGKTLVTDSSIQDISAYHKSQTCVVRQAVTDTCSPCHPVFKEVNQLPYTDYLLKKTLEC